jgi:hypothetical protein
MFHTLSVRDLPLLDLREPSALDGVGLELADIDAGGRGLSAPHLREGPVFSERTSVGLDAWIHCVNRCNSVWR